MKKRHFPFSLLLLFLSLYFDCFFLGFVQTAMTNLVSLNYPGKLKTDWIGAATYEMNQKSVLTPTITGSAILMKPCFSVKGNKKRQTGNLYVSLETKKWFQHSSSVFKSNHFSILPALPFLFLFMLNGQLLLHPQRRWQVEQQLSSCRHFAAHSLLLVAKNFSSLWCSSLWRTCEVSSTKPSLFYCNCTNGAKEAKKVRRTSSIPHYFQNTDMHVSLLN